MNLDDNRDPTIRLSQESFERLTKAISRKVKAEIKHELKVEIKDEIYEDFYADVGKAVIRKSLYAFGALVSVSLALIWDSLKAWANGIFR